MEPFNTPEGRAALGTLIKSGGLLIAASIRAGLAPAEQIEAAEAQIATASDAFSWPSKPLSPSPRNAAFITLEAHV